MLLICVLAVGCRIDTDRDLFETALTQAKQADKLTDALALTGGTTHPGGIPDADGGPTLESIRGSVGLLANTEFVFALTGREDEAEAISVVFGITYASRHVEVPLEPGPAPGVYRLSGTIGEVPKGTWTASVAFVDGDGRVGAPLVLRLDVTGKQAAISESLTLAPHAGATRAIAFGSGAATGTLVTGGHDNQLFLWDLAVGRRIRRFAGHVDWILDAALTSDGATLISASMDHYVRVWDIASGATVLTIGDALDAVTSVAIAPDDSMFAAGSWDGHIRIYDVNGALQKTLPLGVPVNDLTFGADGKFLVAGLGRTLVPGQMRAFDTSTWEPNCALPFDREVTAVAWDPDGGPDEPRVAAAHGRGEITIISKGCVASEPLVHPERRGDTIPSLAFAPGADRHALFAVTLTGELDVWRPDQAQLARTIVISLPAMAVAFSPDGSFVALGAESGATRVLDISDL